QRPTVYGRQSRATFGTQTSPQRATRWNDPYGSSAVRNSTEIDSTCAAAGLTPIARLIGTQLRTAITAMRASLRMNLTGKRMMVSPRWDAWKRNHRAKAEVPPAYFW